MKANDYDDIPVECCACCLSLDEQERVEIDGEIVKVCPYCGSSETRKMTIEDWDEAFVRKYNLGHYLDLPKGMTWDEIIQHENSETAEEENIRRQIRINKQYIFNHKKRKHNGSCKKRRSSQD